MPKVWSSYSNKIVVLFALAGLGWLAAGVASAATFESKTVRFTIRPDGALVEQVEMRVRLDDQADLEAWSVYAVHLDEHRELGDFSAVVIEENGRRRKLGRKTQDRMEFSGSGVVHESSEYHVVEAVGLQVGDRLELSHTVVERPYFPASLWPLLDEHPVERLEITVSGGGPHWRYRLDGPADGLRVEEHEDGVRITGNDLELPETPDLAPGESGRWPILRFAWGEARDWPGVASWYRGLLTPLPGGGEATRSLADELVGADEDSRAKLERLTAYLRDKVRYVAVEVGIGGYQPTPPGEVLDRKWGDCKDKSLLLIDLLASQGIPAYPALIRLDSRSRIDHEFPAPSQFNHLITAVPTSAVSPRSGDPVAGGYLFIDPTQTRGGVGWLHAGVQDQHALVVKEHGGELVRTPEIADHESYYLAFDLELDAAGNATGRAGLLLSGGLASSFLATMDGAPAERVADHVLGIFQNLVPGVRIEGVGWEGSDNEIPTVRMAMAVEIDGLVAGRADRPSLRVPSLRATPDPRQLDDSEGPLVLSPGVTRTVWSIALPDGWCMPEEAEYALANPAGSFERRVGLDAAGQLEIEHKSRLSRRWLEGADLEDLRALTLADYRASRRRVRFDCSSTIDPEVSPPN